MLVLEEHVRGTSVHNKIVGRWVCTDCSEHVRAFGGFKLGSHWSIPEGILSKFVSLLSLVDDLAGPILINIFFLGLPLLIPVRDGQHSVEPASSSQLLSCVGADELRTVAGCMMVAASYLSVASASLDHNACSSGVMSSSSLSWRVEDSNSSCRVTGLG